MSIVIERKSIFPKSPPNQTLFFLLFCGIMKEQKIKLQIIFFYSTITASEMCFAKNAAIYLNKEDKMPVYKNNFLTNVIYRLDFTNISELNSDTMLQDLYKNIKDIFPNFMLETSDENVISVNAITKAQSLHTRRIHRLSCRNENNTTKISLDEKSISVETLKYTSLENFLDFINKANSLLEPVKENVNINRLGLRYINQISIENGSPFDNKDYINEDLTKKEIAFFNNKEQKKLTRSLSQTSLNYDDYQVTFVTGYANSQYPERIMKNEYVIDIDCFTRKCDFAQVEQIIKQMNESTITPLFERSINDGLRDLMQL